MAVRLYLMPLVGSGGTVGDPPEPDPRRPKYPPSNFALIDYGSEALCLVSCDIGAAEHALIAANADVVVIPPLDNQVGAALSVVTARLEAWNIPAGWVTSSTTYREIVRKVCGMFLFLQRYGARAANARLFVAGVGLSTTFAELPAGVRSKLQEAAESFGYDTSGLSSGSTIRQILKFLADEWGARSIRLGAVTI